MHLLENKESFKINDANFHLKKLEKDGQIKVSRMKKIIKIRREISIM